MKKITAMILALIMLSAFLSVPFGASDSEIAPTRSAEDYYLVGSMTDWKISKDHHLTEVEVSGYELYVIRDVYLTVEDQFKFAYSLHGVFPDEWFPYGMGNNFNENDQSIFEDAFYDIYFRPNMDGGSGWFYGCIKLELSDDISSTEGEPGIQAPTECSTSGMPMAGNGTLYIYGTFSDWELKDEYALDRNADGFYEPEDYVYLKKTDRLRVAYSLDGVNIETVFPPGNNDYYTPAYTSRYYKIEFDPACSQHPYDWFRGCIRARIMPRPQDQWRSGINTHVYDYKLEEFMRIKYQEYFSYSELYYHTQRSEDISIGGNYTDWVLVNVVPKTPNAGSSYGVFDEVLISNTVYYPFRFGYGVYDCINDKFYSITQAWDMDFEDLHDVFVHVVKSRGAYLLGDADRDGELTVLDATHLQRFTVHAEELEYDEYATAHKSHSFGPEIKYLTDFNCDGDRDIIDVTLIQRQVTGLELYKHAPTASVKIVEKDGKYYAQASSSFMRGNVKYRYWITGLLHGYSYYDVNNMGAFTFCNDPDYDLVPGGVVLSTGFTDEDCVELPLDSITKDERFTLTITAKDSSGKLSTSECYSFFNSSDK